MAPRNHKSVSKNRRNTPRAAQARPVGMRIIGGDFRGRKLRYGGDQRVRPMKDRVRESLFNLIGPAIEGKHAIDLFGGTGALGLEAISRGAVAATITEQHYPTAKILRENVATLQIEPLVETITADVFIWFRRGPKLPKTPWVVFCSPPYDFYVDRADDLLELIGGLMDAAPPQSIFAVESDTRFDFDRLPKAQEWDIRPYHPAVVGIYVKKEDR
ncbi:MAG: RsmD family RNA methyltransferase [Pirellulales bacterium]|nr:RsmD family RNA methyltransferase [Pirellulales bacterium]